MPRKAVLSSLAFTSLATLLSLTACGGSRTSGPAAPAPPAQDAPRTAEAPPAASPPPAYFETLVAAARDDATRPAADDPPAALPEGLRDLSPAQYATIRFRPEASLWRDGPGRFEVQLFHLGSHYRKIVHIFELASAADREPSPVAFSRALFRYDGVAEPASDAGLGFTGLRLHAPLNREDYRDEVVVFQGSSYLRPVARGLAYGLSARGLALDPGEGSGEEFPRFSALYLVRPAESDDAVWMLARLDSPRATGAYAFHIRPGETTRIDVTARVFLRAPVGVVGVAPLTSMFLFGEQTPARFDDFRPEVHDSDGLALHARGGERIFRPLRNPPRTTVTSFALDSPRGFGLVQRDRRFSHYQDLHERYQDRPSAWIEPLDDWGPGAVRLLEIATKLESDDNVGAFWVPREVPADGLSLRYRIHVGRDLPTGEVFGRVVSTHAQRTDAGRRYVVDFDTAQDDPPPVGDLALEVTAVGGRVLSRSIEHNPFVHGLRATFEVAAEPNHDAVELRAYVHRGPDVLTETWSGLWQPTP